MRGLVTVLLAVITGMFCSFVTYLPFIGDVNSAPNQHVTPIYIERSVQDTGSPNIVTGLLADYRGFDTMWETTVMFLAGLTVVMLLSSSTMGRRPEKEDEDGNMNLKISRDGQMTVTIPASGEGKDTEVPMTYTMNKESKTISIQQDDAQIQKIAEKSDGQYTTETLKNAVQSIGTTFEYSIDDGTLTLTEREYGEQMMFNKN